MTIYEIKELSAKKAPYFFSRDTMRFFHQTLRSFRVEAVADCIYKISAPMRDYRKQIMGITERWFYLDDLYDTFEAAQEAQRKDKAAKAKAKAKAKKGGIK